MVLKLSLLKEMTSSVYLTCPCKPSHQERANLRAIIDYLRPNTRIRVSQMLVKEIKMLLEVPSVGKHLW